MRGKLLHGFYSGFVKPTASLTATTVGAAAVGTAVSVAYDSTKDYVTKQLGSDDQAKSETNLSTTSRNTTF